MQQLHAAASGDTNSLHTYFPHKPECSSTPVKLNVKSVVFHLYLELHCIPLTDQLVPHYWSFSIRAYVLKKTLHVFVCSVSTNEILLINLNSTWHIWTLSSWGTDTLVVSIKIHMNGYIHLIPISCNIYLSLHPSPLLSHTHVQCQCTDRSNRRLEM